MSETETNSLGQPQIRSKARLALATACLAVLASVLFVLPAELGIDLTGFGRLTGLIQLREARAPSPEATSAEHTVGGALLGALRGETFRVAVRPEGEIEYKVRLRQGQAFVYSWAAPGIAPEELYSDLHGESTASQGAEPEVESFQQTTGNAASGVLIAPRDGIYGWYFQNSALSQAEVTLKLSGFYDLIPAGAPGNLDGVSPLP